MRMVIVESQFAADTEQARARNTRFARACVADCLRRGEAPFASHLLYTQAGILDDNIPSEREHGINAGLEIAKRADLTAVYENLGISRGMHLGIRAAEEAGRPIEFRKLECWR